MTPLIARLFISLTLLCAALLGAAKLSGSLTPIPAHGSLLAINTCALPCFFGVIPGETARNDAMMSYERLGLSYSYLNPIQPASFVMHKSENTQSVMALFNFGIPNGKVVRSVQLYQMASGRDLGTLSDFLLAGYQPVRVLSDCESVQRIIITLNDQTVFVQVALGERFTPDAPLMLVGSAVDLDALNGTLRSFRCQMESPWSGFAPQWKYQIAS